LEHSVDCVKIPLFNRQLKRVTDRENRWWLALRSNAAGRAYMPLPSWSPKRWGPISCWS